MVLAIVIAAGVVFAWLPLVRQVERWTGYELMPREVATTQPATQPQSAPPSIAPSASPVMTPGAVTVTPGITATETTPTSTPTPGALNVTPARAFAAGPVTLGSDKTHDPAFALRVDVSPTGGGLQQVVLNDFPAAVKGDARFSFEKPYESAGIRSLSIRTITINGQTTDLGNSVWKIDRQTQSDVTLSLDISDGARPLMTLYKSFSLKPRSEGGDAGPRGHEMLVRHTFVNRSDQPLVVSAKINGPTFPPSELPAGYDRQVIAGYKGKNSVIIRHDMLETFGADPAFLDYTIKDNMPLLWIGSGGNYFNAIVRPVGESWIKQATAAALDANTQPRDRSVVITLQTNDMTLGRAAQKEIEAQVFFGPRQRDLLKNTYYTAPGIEYQHTLEISSSCAICTFQWLVDFLMSLLGMFHVVVRDWGVAIIMLVFVVRAVLHPITKKSQVNMAKMSKMGPELERLKKKHANDKEALNRAMLGFYKTQGATPILGCLPMFLQMPIWIALYSGLSTTFELRLSPFFYGLTWIDDLAKPDHLIKFDQAYHLLFLTVDGFNLIPFLLAIAFFMQMKLQPKPPTMSPEQAQQQKMMQWMTLLFPIFLYSSPSGLNIYILASTVFGIIESKIIRKHIDEQDARAALAPTIVDAEVIDRPRAGAAVVKKKGGIVGWFQNLQERAEQLRQDANKKSKKK